MGSVNTGSRVPVVKTPVHVDSGGEQESSVLQEVRREYPELNAVNAFILPIWFYRQDSWVSDSVHSESSLYNYPIAVALKGPLEVASLNRSLEEVQRRHEVLRSVIRNINGRAIQIILSSAPVPIELIELGWIAAPEREMALSRAMRERAKRPFDLQNDRLLRATLFRLDADTHVLQLDTHHLVCDDWSTGILVHDLFSAYELVASGGEVVFRAPAFSYTEFIHWREQRQKSEERRKSSYKAALGGSSRFFHLQPDSPRPCHRTRDGATLNNAIPHDLTRALSILCQQHKVTLFMVLLAGFQSLLHSYSGDKEVGVGTCAANRPLPKLEGVVGRFANDIVVRTDYSGNPTFREIIARTRDAALDAYGYQDVPFGSILESLFPLNDPASTPLFQTTFILQNAPKSVPRIANLEISRMSIDTQTSKYDLAVWVKSGDNIDISFEYNRDLFRAETVARIAEDYEQILWMMVADSDQSVPQRETLKRGTMAAEQGREIESSVQVASPTSATCTSMERELTEIWQDVLGVQVCGISQNFFELGGDSLRAVQLIAHIQQRLGKQLPFRSLFSAPTIRAQAQVLLHEQDHQLRNHNEPQVASAALESQITLAAMSNRHVKKSAVRRMLNRALHVLCRLAPGATTLRPFLHRLRGVRIGQGVWIGDEVYLENEYPECIEIHDGAILSVRSLVIAHTQGAGEIVIGRNAFIGAGAVIVTSGNRRVEIGDGAVIMAASLVNGSVPPKTLYGTDQSRVLARVTKAFTSDTSFEELISSLRPLSR